MALKNIQLCHLDKANRGAEGMYTVTVHSDDTHKHAVFDCESEYDAIQLRNAIREHALRLRQVNDFAP